MTSASQSTAQQQMTLQQTQANQADAADPGASVWVSANAGTGKTHVLTMRVMRLLLAGTPPERILCLTYTKAAAAEMSSRVFDKLAKWVTAAEDDLQELLHELLERPPSDLETARARQLFARAIETPGGLKVQTIHAFCERLLQRFPLEAGVPPHFSSLDEETARRLQREAVNEVLAAATQKRGGPLMDALLTAIAYAADDNFDAILGDALRKRDWLEFMTRRDLSASGLDIAEDSLAQAEADYRRIFGLSETATKSELEADLAGILSDDICETIRQVLLTGTKSDANAAAQLANVIAATSPEARVPALDGLFLTGKGTPRTKLMTNKLSQEHADIAARFQQAQERFVALYDDLLKLKLLQATMAILRLAGAVMQRYARAKARRAALDFDDLLDSASNLLGSSASAAWVLYKLDGGLDHILVDEAQDTSPVQWSVIQALASEFFAGSGARDDVRTLFAVGDEKQSIYGFQGAAPKMFAKMGAQFEELAQASGLTWRQIPLTLSFRSVAPVLGAVDKIFADAAKVPGLTASEAAIRHDAFRIGQAGMIEIWPTEKHEEESPGEIWSPLADATASEPVTRLAGRIADQIKSWLDDGEMLTSANRPVRAGDIIILLRKRRPFADSMVTALKARGIAVAGADRMKLIEQIAVQDLMALGDFLVLPEDDLSLATVLKSPLFGFTDEHLLTLAYPNTMENSNFNRRGRSLKNSPPPRGEGAGGAAGEILNLARRSPLHPTSPLHLTPNPSPSRGGGKEGDDIDKRKGGSLWSALLAHAKGDPDHAKGDPDHAKGDADHGKGDAIFAQAAERLKEWRSSADFVPPYEFYAALLDRDKGRQLMLARLGPEAADPIDEFLNLALSYDESAPPSLLGFLDWLRHSDREIKRDMEHGRDEVRVMTVHGAKGLEAPIVFLPDTCTTKSGGGPGMLLDMGSVAQPLGDASPAPMVWPVKGTSNLEPVQLAKDALAAKDAEERHRLLYVAMTRARDRLYVAGFEGRRGRAKGCWYDLITQGLGGLLQTHRLADGRDVLRFGCEQGAEFEQSGTSIAGALEAVRPPIWATKPAPREPILSIPLAPSRLAPPETDDFDDDDATGQPTERQDASSQSLDEHDQGIADPPVLSPRALSSNYRFLRGTLSHALLEHLPQLDPGLWDKAARSFIAKRGTLLPKGTRDSIASEVLAVLRAPQFAPLFGPDSQAEVPIVAQISPPDGKPGATLKVNGQIDRLALIGDDVFIVDYKTNRPPPDDPEKVSKAYLLQLAAYRLAVREVYTKHRVRAAILWTDGVRIMEIPEKLLDFHELRLWRQGRQG